MQQAAYEALTSRDYAGAVVALRPQTGQILAMASTPTYDPNQLASHNSEDQTAAWTTFNDADPPVLPNRAIAEHLPARLDVQVDRHRGRAAERLHPGQPAHGRAARSRCRAPRTHAGELRRHRVRHGRRRPSLRDALARSCNTAFAELGAQLGERQDPRAGRGVRRSARQPPAIPMPVAPSTLGDIPDTAALQQSAIGQRDVRFTPLQNAMIVAAIANGGQVMAPYLVKQMPGPTWTCSTRPSRTGSAGRCPRTSRRRSPTS